MKYIKIYHWNVLDWIEEGERVYFLDKKEKETGCINELFVDYALRLLKAAKTDFDRFEFWKEEKENA